MESLPKDVVQEMALNLSPADLIEFCTSSKKYNKILCESETFWRRKLEKDYPEVVYQVQHKIGGDVSIVVKRIKNPKELYINKFKHISQELEEAIERIIRRFYGEHFRAFFTEKYKTDFLKSLYTAFQKVQDLTGDEVDNQEEIIAEHSRNFLPVHTANMDFAFDEEENPYSIINDRFESIMTDALFDRSARKTLKEYQEDLNKWKKVN